MSTNLLSVKYRTKPNNAACVALALIVGYLLFWSGAEAVGRRLEVGHKVPEFSATDIASHPFDYKHGKHKPMIIAFLSTTQKRSVQAANDIDRIVANLDSRAGHLDVIMVTYDANDNSDFGSQKQGQPRTKCHVLSDDDFRLWGKFGIIAMPTVIISDANDTVLCVKAGYANNFTPAIRAQLNQALGIAQETPPEDADKVRVATIDKSVGRARRHLQMAKMFKKNGRLKLALQQLQEARQLDPNCFEVKLELGELHCQMGRGKTALEVIDHAEGSSRLEKARTRLILGWAKRLTGQLDAAEQLLLEATLLDPKSSRSFFELGKVYQAKGQTNKAMESYRRALQQLFDEVEEIEDPDERQQGQKSDVSKSTAPMVITQYCLGTELDTFEVLFCHV